MNADTRHMRAALALAERGRGRTSPNPMVGAVIVDGEGVVVGRGAHEYAGGPHAEIHALADAGPRARGGTLYCTLEPCSHAGRTGPCAPRVIEAGISRVVAAVQDPNPLVAGRGLAWLREHGVDVSVGVLREQAERLNAPFFSVMRRQRPFVTMKVALSREGFVAAGHGVRTPLTGVAANRLIHRERAEVDAIAVGSGTILSDDPLLTPRGAFRTRPLARIIFDRSVRTPPAARILSTLDAGPVILVAATRYDEPTHRRIQSLMSAGVSIELPGGDDDEAMIRNALATLARRSINSVIVEGGPTLHRAMWKAGVVDRVQIFQTPVVLGANGVEWFSPESFRIEELVAVTTTRLGDDSLIEGYVHRPD